VVVAALGVVAVLVFVLGVGLGAGEHDAGAGAWSDRLRGLGGGTALTTADLVPGGGACAVDGQVVTFSGGCAFDVPAAGGRFGLGPPTRRATLVVGAAPVRLALLVEGQEIQVDLDPGDAQDLTFGRSGGRLALACRGLSGCAVALRPAGWAVSGARRRRR
jgi:hypothetical protein